MMGSRVRVTQAAPKNQTKSVSWKSIGEVATEVVEAAEPRRNQTGPEPTPRRPMSAKRRHHIFSEHCTGHNVAPCCICGDPIHRYDDQWIIEHKRALGLLGKDTNVNCAPAHEDCRRSKDKIDAAMMAKAKRQALAAMPRNRQPVAISRPLYTIRDCLAVEPRAKQESGKRGF